MRIIKALPPNIDEIDAAFGVRKILEKQSIYFSWGDRIFNPGGTDISPAIMRHEIVHGMQQKSERDARISIDHGCRAWWIKYLHDPEFRLAQEIEAHRAEYEWHRDRNEASQPYRGYRSRLDFRLQQIALRLSGPLYGRLISLSEAKKAIAT